VGERLHAAVIIGSNNIRSEAADFGLDGDWVDTEVQPGSSAPDGVSTTLDNLLLYGCRVVVAVPCYLDAVMGRDEARRSPAAGFGV
jgi:hypothetical protein